MPKDLVETYREIISAVAGDDEAALRKLLADDIVDHNPLPDQAPGIEGFLEWVRYLGSALADTRCDIHDAFVHEDKVVAQVTWQGTHKGEFLGVPGTGKPLSIDAIHIVRFDDGKAIEWWGVANLLAPLTQAGATIQPHN